MNMFTPVSKTLTAVSRSASTFASIDFRPVVLGVRSLDAGFGLIQKGSIFWNRGTHYPFLMSGEAKIYLSFIPTALCGINSARNLARPAGVYCFLFSISQIIGQHLGRSNMHYSSANGHMTLLLAEHWSESLRARLGPFESNLSPPLLVHR